MTRRILVLAVVSAFAVAESAPAIDLGFGLLKRRQEKKQQQSAEKQHVTTLQTDLDEDKRKEAADALKGVDPKANFDAVAALAAAVMKDPSPEVRATAAEALGAFKVVYKQAAEALEKAGAEDPDESVRAAAKAALWQYSLSGYKPAVTTAKTQSAEPPLARAPVEPSPVSTGGTASKPVREVPFRVITQGPTTAAPRYEQSPEPPLATATPKAEPKPLPPTVVPPTAPVPTVPQRMPATVPQPLPANVPPPTVDLPPASRPTDTTTSVLPLPSVPTLPPPARVPTVQPPSK